MLQPFWEVAQEGLERLEQNLSPNLSLGDITDPQLAFQTATTMLGIWGIIDERKETTKLWALQAPECVSSQIIALKGGGQSTADLENQRDAAVQTVSQLVQVRTLEQPNGDMLLTTTGGLALPTRGGGLTASNATLSPGAFYPGGGIPAVTLGGADVTRQLTGGRIGAGLTLRDTTLPTFQAELDQFAQNLAGRFDAQGLDLFTDPAGNVPAASGTPPMQGPYVGFAGTVQVNPAVAATPSLVRDGTAAAPTGLAGYTGVIQNVLNYTFGNQQSAGVPQPPFNTGGLGPSGTLSAPFAAPATLGGFASTLVAAQAQESATVSSQLDVEHGLQGTLAGKLATGSAVNMDEEMATMLQLQNSYGVTARIMTAVQSMVAQLMDAVR